MTNTKECFPISWTNICDPCGNIIGIISKFLYWLCDWLCVMNGAHGYVCKMIIFLWISWEKFILLLIVRLCLIVNFLIIFYGIGCKFSLIVSAIVQLLPCWLCDCAILTMLIVQLLPYWLCDCAKICILIVRLCENMHFDCAIVWKYVILLFDCAIVLDCVDCVWLCGLPWANFLKKFWKIFNFRKTSFFRAKNATAQRFQFHMLGVG